MKCIVTSVYIQQMINTQQLYMQVHNFYKQHIQLLNVLLSTLPVRQWRAYRGTQHSLHTLLLTWHCAAAIKMMNKHKGCSVSVNLSGQLSLVHKKFILSELSPSWKVNHQQYNVRKVMNHEISWYWLVGPSSHMKKFRIQT